jgi:hypothetical protein
MDTTPFQLFSLGEILTRLGQTLQTGCLHIFTERDAANIYFKDGIVVAANRGLLDNEEVLKQIVEWKEPRMVWQPNEIAPSSLKSFGVNIIDYLHPSKVDHEKKKSHKLNHAIKDHQKPVPVNPPLPKPVVFIAETPSPSPSISAFPAALPAKVTPTLILAPPTASEPSAPKTPDLVHPISTPSIQLTATKAIPSTALARSNQEEALLRKYKLVLISGEDRTQQFKVLRASSLIGRNPACDITLNRSSVSRQHCLLHLTDRGIHLKDLGTTNGTKVNGIVLTEGYVNPGDKLTIGHELFTLEKEADEALSK